MTDIGRNLRRLLNKSETYRGNAKRLSLESGVGETGVRDIISGRSKQPQNGTLAKIADKLGCTVNDLVTPTADDSPSGESFTRIVRRSPRRSNDLIPIRSAGRGGGEQEMFASEVIGYTPRPANLGGVVEAYAIYMVGDSMEPRYEQGWLLHINPFRPPSRGRDVVVYRINGAVLVKRFIRKTDAELIVAQLNPAEEIRIPVGEVKEFHLIVGSDQEGG